MRGTERVAVGFGLVGEVGRGRADVRAQDEQRRRTAVGFCCVQRMFEFVQIVCNVAELDDVPAVRAETLRDVVAARKVGRAVDGDLVVVEYADESVELLVPSERCRLVTDAFHEATVASNDEDVVVMQFVAETRAKVALGNRHADCVGETLAERAGRHFDAGGVTAFWVTGRRRTPLAEVAQVIEFEAVAVQVERRVLQDRRVAVGEDEAVAIAPVRLRRVVAHHSAVEHVGEWRERHGRALVTTFCRERRVHREPANHRDGETVLFAREPFRHGSDDSWRALRRASQRQVRTKDSRPKLTPRSAAAR